MSSKINIPAFIICLDNHVCNYNNLEKYISNLTRFSAITPETNDLEIQTKTKYMIKNNIRKSAYDLHKGGEVGCFASHYHLWKKCVDMDEPIIIAEDDVRLNENKYETIYNVFKNNSFNKIDFLSLLYLYNNGIKTKNKSFNRIGDHFMGMIMYYITPSGARKLIAQALPIHMCADSYIAMMSSMNEINAYAISKRLYTLDRYFLDTFKSSLNNNIWSAHYVMILPDNNLVLLSIIIILIFIGYYLGRNSKKCLQK